ncbi:hypothetical protein AYI70_g5604, partial [Smittium culicis]
MGSIKVPVKAFRVEISFKPSRRVDIPYRN